ncbi:MAG: hypothetical protein DMF85_18120 [Acidobacteria bacterium]|nr:MAG: hypothetical protein DMF85_18120 [Acidobacteriota bacterium]
MKTDLPFPAHLTDAQLLVYVKALAAGERDATARLIASLMELDSRKLYLGEGCSSLFTYCTQVLRLSEHAAYGRIAAARAARRFPIILPLLADGSLNLTTVCLLAPHLTPDNHRELLTAATHKSKREVEHLVATISPQPDPPTSVRRLPTPKIAQRVPSIEPPQPRLEPPAPAMCRPATPEPAIVAPLAPERYKVQFTVSRETYEKLRRAQELLRHTVPNGDPGAIFDRALTVLLAEVEKQKCGATARPRGARPAASSSRRIPAAVKREVWARDGGRCAFVGVNGRCTERGFLEYHHVQPFADGGLSVAQNLQLRCRAHNAYEAEQWFGPLVVREVPAPWLTRTRSGPSSEVAARAFSATMPSG